MFLHFLHNQKINLIKAGGIVLLFLWGLAGSVNPNAMLLLKQADLLIHEIGHLFFDLSGDATLTVLGGTLLQVLVPAGFTAYFLCTRQRFSVVFGLFWLAVNLFDIAVYMADARALALPLASIAPDEGDIGHDWNILFSQWNVLSADTRIAGVVTGIGRLVLLASLLLGLWWSLERSGAAGHDHREPQPEALPLASLPTGDTTPPPARERRPAVVTDFLKGSRK